MVIELKGNVQHYNRYSVHSFSELFLKSFKSLKASSRPQSTITYTQYVMDTNKMSLKLNTHRSLWNALGNP